jgi:hypothetical protein
MILRMNSTQVGEKNAGEEEKKGHQNEKKRGTR